MTGAATFEGFWRASLENGGERVAGVHFDGAKTWLAVLDKPRGGAEFVQRGQSIALEHVAAYAEEVLAGKQRALTRPDGLLFLASYALFSLYFMTRPDDGAERAPLCPEFEARAGGRQTIEEDSK